MFHLREIAVLFLASLWLVQGQPGTVRQGEYDVLRNSSGGPIVCAMDQPQLVRTDTRSRLHCSTTCLQNNQCMCFNYKDSVSAGSEIACEHFDGYPFNFTVNSACRHYAVSENVCVLPGEVLFSMPCVCLFVWWTIVLDSRRLFCCFVDFSGKRTQAKYLLRLRCCRRSVKIFIPTERLILVTNHWIRRLQS